MGSITDVARYAGVSIGTVSRAFNGYADISAETKRRVFEAAERLDYVPNMHARNLSSKRKRGVGLIISGLLDNDPRENLMFQLMQGVYAYACTCGLDVAIYATDSAHQRRLSYKRFCTEHSIAGAVLSGVTVDDAYFNELISCTSIPCVAIDVEIPGKQISWVSIDNEGAAADMARMLLENGHRRLMVMSGKQNAEVSHVRLAGVRRALSEAGTVLEDDDILYGDYHEETAYRRTLGYLNRCTDCPHTAFLCFSDIMALGVMRALREKGKRIPEDVSVTGFDGIPLTEYISPPLTTVYQNMKESGFEGIKLLHEIILQKSTARHKILPYRIISRSSVKNIAP